MMDNKSEKTIATYNRAANQYDIKSKEVDLYDDTYDLFCAYIKKANANILDIACGPGNVTKYLLDNLPNLKITGIDLAPNMIRLAKQNVPTAEFKVLDCREIHRIRKKYDAIMCGFCIPYLSKEECSDLIYNSFNLLEENGILYLSTMEGDYRKSGFETTNFSGEDQVYIYYHHADVLTKTLIDAKFKIINIHKKEYSGRPNWTNLLIIAKKT